VNVVAGPGPYGNRPPRGSTGEPTRRLDPTPPWDPAPLDSTARLDSPTQLGSSPASPGRRVSAQRLWASGLATALVAALAAVVAMILIRGVFNVPVFAPRGEGTWGNANTAYLAACSALAALVATGLLHLLLVIVARPRTFFVWIAGLATAALMLLPLTTGLDLSTRLGSAAVFLIIGVTITALLHAIVPSVVRVPDRRGYLGP
jgi:hypothetical protein